MKKYEILDSGRIRALHDFGSVKAGDLGGYVAGEHNLSHDGLCWVFDSAQVLGAAWVHGDAQVCGDAVVSSNAEVGK